MQALLPHQQLPFQVFCQETEPGRLPFLVLLKPHYPSRESSFLKPGLLCNQETPAISSLRKQFQ